MTTKTNALKKKIGTIRFTPKQKPTIKITPKTYPPKSKGTMYA